MALVYADKLRLIEDIALHRVERLLSAGACWQIQRSIECVECETVVVRLALRWAGRTVTSAAKVVAPLHGAVGEALYQWHVLLQVIDVAWDVEEHPVGEGALWCIGIVHDQRERGDPLRRSAPCERRRHMLTVTGVPNWDVLTWSERAALKLECHNSLPISSLLGAGAHHSSSYAVYAV